MRARWLTRTLQTLAALAATGVATLVFHRFLPPAFNPTTVGFGYLLLVVAIAGGFGFYPALWASLAATAQYNYFFLPPVGSFNIDDPRNWVALAVFLLTATVASELSALAQRQAREAEAGRREMARLFELSRAILLIEPGQLQAGLERALVRIFGFRDVRLALPGAAPVPSTGAFTMSWRLHVGQHSVGTLHALGEPLGAETAEAVAALAAIAIERERLLAETGRLRAARESEALKSALLDSVTHDVRTPLTAIKAAATALLATPAPADRELLAAIDEEADRLNALIEDMVEMARIEAGHLRATPQPQALAPLVEAALAPLRLPPGRVRLDLPDELPPVLADGRLIDRVLAQLVGNALAYSPADTTIWIEARVIETHGRGGAVRVTVCDHGPGIARELLPHIFDKFARGPGARRDRPAGLGMGLAIARGLVGAHRGEIGVDSEPGAGARFWFTLPAQAVESREHDGGYPYPDR